MLSLLNRVQHSVECKTLQEMPLQSLTKTERSKIGIPHKIQSLCVTTCDPWHADTLCAGQGSKQDC